MDDYLMVQESAFYSKIENIPKSFSRSVWHPTGNEYNYYRPASTSVYILGAWVSTLISNDILPWIFHLTNVLLQIAVALLLFSLLKAIGCSIKVAFFTTLVLIIHPASAGTLGWIPGQNELLLAVAVIAGFLCFVHGIKSKIWFLPHGLCFLLGMLTKENAAGLPILCAMYLLFSPERKRWSIWLCSFAAWGATATLWLLMLSQGGSGAPPEAGGALQGMWHGLPYVLIYLGQLFMPVGLSTLPTPQDTPLYFWIAGGLGAVFVIGLTLWKLRERPMMLIGAAWFGGFLLPTFANMVPQLKDTFILRSDRVYLASVGILIVFAQIREQRWRMIFAAKPARATLVLVTLLMLGLNLQHQFHFQTGMAFYQSGVDGSPRSAFARTHLGDMYLYAKDIQGGIEQYLAAIAINPYQPQARNNLGVAYMRAGDMEKAAEQYVKELEFNPKNLLTWSNLGSIYLKKGDYANAEIAFKRAVQLNPAYKDAWAGLYKIYEFQKREVERSEALKNLQKAEMDMSRGI
jgi:protein O-mannosyl-transferase